MILNISGRTDIVGFYTPWFLKRLKAGFVDVRNHYNETQVSRIYFSDVDEILFCTKNPIPIVKYLKKINKPIIFHVTLTPYKKDIEPNVPPKGLVIEAIKKILQLLVVIIFILGMIQFLLMINIVFHIILRHLIICVLY